MRPRGWWFDALLLALFAALTVALARGHLLGLDQSIADWADQHRPPPLHWLAVVLNFLGQGGWLLTPLLAILAVLAVRRHRSIRPALVFVATYLLLYGTVGPLKLWMSRDAPHSELSSKVELFNDQIPPGGYSLGYPSGHVANTLVWYGSIALLLGVLVPLTARQRLLIRVLPPIIVFCTTTYLAWHWITDSIAGLLLGLVLTRLMARIDWNAIPLPDLKGWERPLARPLTRA